MTPSMKRAGWMLIILASWACALPGCEKAATVEYPAKAGMENRGSSLSRGDYTQLYNERKDDLLRNTNMELDAAYRATQTTDAIVFACVPEANWVEKHGKLQVGLGFPETDDAVNIQETVDYVVQYVEYIDGQFGIFNDYLAIVDTMPADRTAKELAMTQGLLVLYLVQSLRSLTVEQQGSLGRCSFSPVASHLAKVDSMFNELSTAQLPTLLSDLERNGVAEQDRTRFEVPLLILSGQSAQARCESIDERYEEHQDYGMLLAWCGFNASNSQDPNSARQFWDRAKLVRGDATVSSYASKALTGL